MDELRENDLEEGVNNSVTERLKEERMPAGGVGSVAKKIGINKAKVAREREEREAVLDREKRAYLNATECPICFLVGPFISFIAYNRIIPQISTHLAAVNNPSVPNASSRSNGPKRL